jgi:hypothetical protein
MIGCVGDTTLMPNALCLRVACGQSIGEPTRRFNLAERNSNQQKIKQVLTETKIPMDVENIREQSGLKNWESTKSILLEMVLQGSILGQRTTKGWIFWVNPAAMQSRRRA